MPSKKSGKKVARRLTAEEMEQRQAIAAENARHRVSLQAQTIEKIERTYHIVTDKRDVADEFGILVSEVTENQIEEFVREHILACEEPPAITNVIDNNAEIESVVSVKVVRS